MSPLYDPETHQPVPSLDEFKRVTRRIAGLPEYEMDDPGRPFTDEYENPPVQPIVTATTESEVVDDSPSSDNRGLYAQPTPQELRQIRRNHVRNAYIDPAKAVLRAIHDRREAEKAKKPWLR